MSDIDYEVAFGVAQVELSKAKAEVERLSGLLKAKTTPGYEMFGSIIVKKDAEIELLRIELSAAQVGIGALQGTVERLRAANKELLAVLTRVRAYIKHCDHTPAVDEIDHAIQASVQNGTGAA